MNCSNSEIEEGPFLKFKNSVEEPIEDHILIHGTIYHILILGPPVYYIRYFSRTPLHNTSLHLRFFCLKSFVTIHATYYKNFDKF